MFMMECDLFTRFTQIYAPDLVIKDMTNSEIESELEKLKTKSPYRPESRKDLDELDELDEIESDGNKVRYRDGDKIISETANDKIVSQVVRVDINYQIPTKYDLPEDMKSFYRRMGKS